MIASVIFDLDGTLLDTMDDIVDAVNKVLTGEGLSPRTVEEVRDAVGHGVEHLVARLVGDSVTSDRVLRLAGAVSRAYGEGGAVKTRPYEGIPVMLRRLTAMGVPMAVLTNKPHKFANELIGRFFSAIPFRIVAGAVPGRPLKPAADAVVAVLRVLGTDAGSTLMVGDSDVDMDTASNAGLVPVGVSWGFRNVDVLLSHGATKVVDFPEEIPDLLALPDTGKR